MKVLKIVAAMAMAYCIPAQGLLAGDLTVKGDLIVTNDLNVHQDLVVTGSVTAASFSGDGSGLTGISASAVTNAIDSRYVDASGDAMTGALDMNTNLISNVATPVNDGDAINKEFLRSVLSYLPAQGDVTMGSYTNGVTGDPPLTFE